MRGTFAIALVSSLAFSSYAFAQTNSPAPAPNQARQAEQSDGLEAFGQAAPPGFNPALLIGGGAIIGGGVLVGDLVNNNRNSDTTTTTRPASP
jgi:hypothetical protein